jgi:hypothetical protein
MQAGQADVSVRIETSSPGCNNGRVTELRPLGRTTSIPPRTCKTGTFSSQPPRLSRVVGPRLSVPLSRRPRAHLQKPGFANKHRSIRGGLADLKLSFNVSKSVVNHSFHGCFLTSQMVCGRNMTDDLSIRNFYRNGLSMNKSYRSVWNESLGAWVATSELTMSRGKRSKAKVVAGAATVLMAVTAWAPAAHAQVTVGTGHRGYRSGDGGREHRYQQ